MPDLTPLERELLECLRNLLPFALDVQDCGPFGEGWKSDECLAAICNAEGIIAKAEAQERAASEAT